MPYCCAFGCTNLSGKVTGRSFYQIPNPLKEKERASRWIRNIGNTKINIKTLVSSKDKVVCSDHFHEHCIQRDFKYEMGLKKKKSKFLIDGSVPTIFKHKVYDEINMDGTKIIRRTSASQERKQDNERQQECNMVEDTSKATVNETSNENNADLPQVLKKQVLSRSSSKDDSGDDSLNDPNKKLKRKSDGLINHDTKKLRIENGEVIADLDESVFEWHAYLKETNSSAVSEAFFKHIVPECMCGFEAGMKLEVLNKDYKNTYWLATIIAKASPLILVRYEGFRENNEADFWCNTLTDDIHPVGWCARTKHALKPPKAIQHQEKNWYAYLIKNLTGARKASENLFLKKSHPVHYLRAGHYVEVIDQYNPTCYWLCRIIEVFSGRLNLQYEGYEEPNGLWCYYLSENLRPVGYGLKNSLTLYPPRSSQTITHAQFGRITEKLINLSKRSDNTVFKTLFQDRTTKQAHNLRLGMKLEAVHPNDSTKICVASVTRIFDTNFFLVKIDNLISLQDDVTDSFVAHKYSPFIFQVGFCTKNGLPLEMPKGHIGKFNWDHYLKYTKAEPIPSNFFPERDDVIGIDAGMKLEAVDRETQTNICVCTVRKIINGHLWLHIDGDTRDEQIFSCDSHDIFPVGWCESTGHELQWPRPDTLEQKNRISSLRHTATRQNRLEVLRKGKLRENTGEVKEAKKDVTPNQKQKRKQTVYKHQRRGVSRNKRIVNDDGTEGGTIDTTIAFVCINRLAEEFNTEESIKEFYHIDSDGRLPTQVVTIDDDDDEDEENADTITDNSGKLITLKATTKDDITSLKFTESDLDYFCSLRVKPKTLSKKEGEMFDKKLTENEANKGVDIDDISGLPANANNRKNRSLNSVVAMLTATKSQNKSQLLEQYRQTKFAKNKLLSPDKQDAKTTLSTREEPEQPIIDLSNDDFGLSDNQPRLNDPLNILNTPDGSINIPGKGQYRIVEQIVTKQGDKNKIILRLGKPSANQASSGKKGNPAQNIQQPTQSPKITSSTHVSQPTTSVNDMFTLSNMARSHPGLDEVLRNRFNKVRSFCKTLPKNPLLWTKKDVATFITNADFAKYANNFHDQEMDGHALLLLTVQEIHHILGVRLGPAMKIHDFIYSLQQLVNDAYLNNKNKTPVPRYDKNDTREECSTSSHTTGASEILSVEKEVVPIEPTVKQNEVLSTKIKTNPDMSDPITAAVELSKEKVAKWIDNNNDTLEKIRIQTAFEFKSGETSLGPTYISKQIASAVKYVHTSDVYTTTDPITSPSSAPKLPIAPHNYFGQTVRFIQIPPTVAPAPTSQNSKEGMIYPTGPIQFIPIGNQPVMTNGENFNSGTTPGVPYMVPIPTKIKEALSADNTKTETQEPGTNDVVNPMKPNNDNSINKSEIASSGEKRPPSSDPDAENVKPEKIKKPDDASDAIEVSACFPANDKETYNNHLSQVEISLMNKELWEKFYKSGTEMILTRTGRRMFPSLQINITGMNDCQKYAIILDFVPVDNFRYKFEFETSRWMYACDEGTPPPTRFYVHPKYPSFGSNWMSSVVDFTKCKLTNNSVEAAGHILLHSMHKYQPRIHIILWDSNLPPRNPFELFKYGCQKMFLFEQTKFIAVTAYQNNQVTQLKIDSNPFARGFRGDWRKEKEKKERKKAGEDDDGVHDDGVQWDFSEEYEEGEDYERVTQVEESIKIDFPKM